MSRRVRSMVDAPVPPSFKSRSSTNTSTKFGRGRMTGPAGDDGGAPSRAFGTAETAAAAAASQSVEIASITDRVLGKIPRGTEARLREFRGLAPKYLGCLPEISMVIIRPPPSPSSLSLLPPPSPSFVRELSRETLLPMSHLFRSPAMSAWRSSRSSLMIRPRPRNRHLILKLC
jgi:hypothetical protein